ncbi:NAD(P)/FAD-dependent oxidoreductase [Prevotella sp. OH937_COT-195]|uniref:NAD(P)/FAD-dependent oxidoreductase n=1 Tax=Prevotella sp. OH937_COT-195 TaxID=2491051 RepID=UPI001F2958F6|nr:NAD(P)/FAD-dependent oxidoreductase [Prevotella sp. OH937_COT-195]
MGNLNLNTLESKVYPHLFFAGEVTNIDAVTGELNLQAAWTMCYVTGKSIVE